MQQRLQNGSRLNCSWRNLDNQMLMVSTLGESEPDLTLNEFTFPKGRCNFTECLQK